MRQVHVGKGVDARGDILRIVVAVKTNFHYGSEGLPAGEGGGRAGLPVERSTRW
jgi:hypothetical protein